MWLKFSFTFFVLDVLLTLLCPAAPLAAPALTSVQALVLTGSLSHFEFVSCCLCVPPGVNYLKGEN